MDSSAAIEELQEKLSELEGEASALEEQYAVLGDRVEQSRRERSALRIAIGSLGGDAGDDIDEEVEEDDGRIRVRTRIRRGRSSRGPTIRKIAIAAAEAGGGRVVLRDLLRRTRAQGFKSDHGGLHTYLKGLDEFMQSGPGVFELLIEDEIEPPPIPEPPVVPEPPAAPEPPVAQGDD